MTVWRRASLLLPLFGLVMLVVPVACADPVSGFEYLSEANQQLQQDEFANPGYFWVDAGEALFHEGPADKACSDCHQRVDMEGVALNFPKYDADKDALVNLSQQINKCRVERQGLAPLKFESNNMLSLTTWLTHLSRGKAIEVTVTDQTRPFFEAGREFYYRRRGQLNLSCAHCHEQSAGKRLRGEVISQGHSNGYPAYRHVRETLGSIHRMFQWCNEAVRAKPYPKGSSEYVNLEYYLKWRGNGLEIEAPAVRR